MIEPLMLFVGLCKLELLHSNAINLHIIMRSWILGNHIVVMFFTEVNECALGVDECEPHSTCQDLKGSYFGSYRCEGEYM